MQTREKWLQKEKEYEYKIKIKININIITYCTK